MAVDLGAKTCFDVTGSTSLDEPVDESGVDKPLIEVLHLRRPLLCDREGASLLIRPGNKKDRSYIHAFVGEYPTDELDVLAGAGGRNRTD